MRVLEINPTKYRPATEAQKADVITRMNKMRKDGEKLIKGMFEFIDAQAGFFDFSYRFFPGEPIRTVRIQHGEVCELPTILVRHLNNTYKKIRTIPENLDMGGGGVVKTSRTRFTPMDALALPI